MKIANWMGRFFAPLLALVLVAAASSAPTTMATGAAAATQAERNDEIRALLDRAIANQHRNDDALMLYERWERRILRKEEPDRSTGSGRGGRVTEDKTFRVVPTGTGTLRLVVEERGRAVKAELYRKQLRDLEQALVWALDPNDRAQKQRVEKWKRRSRERTELVDATRDAFRIAGHVRETVNGGSASLATGRTLVRVELEPNPAFRSRSRQMDWFKHVRATLWIDEAAAQIVRLEAEMITDLSIFGGVFGKVYRGGRFVLEQAEVAPGVWLPSRYQFDFAGRRFVFGFETHEVTEARNYRRIGPPREALAAVRRELNNTPGSSSAP